MKKYMNEYEFCYTLSFVSSNFQIFNSCIQNLIEVDEYERMLLKMFSHFFQDRFKETRLPGRERDRANIKSVSF